jgi:cytidylate kinase
MPSKNQSLVIIAVSGPTGSGKSTLAHTLAQQFDGQYLSFGSFVREEALRLGMPQDRISLQNIGQKLIDELGTTLFVERVLSSLDFLGQKTAFLDGVRSVEIWKTVQIFFNKHFLLYLRIEESVCMRRLKARDGLTFSEIATALMHPMERGISQLQKYADLLVEESPLSDMIATVRTALAREKLL